MLPTVFWETSKTISRTQGWQKNISMTETIRPCPFKIAVESFETGVGIIGIVSGAFGILLYTGTLPIGISHPALLYGSITAIAVGGILMIDGSGAFIWETALKKRNFPKVAPGEYTYKHVNDRFGPYIVFYGRYWGKNSLFVRIITVKEEKEFRYNKTYNNLLLAQVELEYHLQMKLQTGLTLASDKYTPKYQDDAELAENYYSRVVGVLIKKPNVEEEERVPDEKAASSSEAEEAQDPSLAEARADSLL